VYLDQQNAATISIIDQHIPSLTDAAEEEIDEMLASGAYDNADLAIRFCRCGVRLDGFDEYWFHLKEVLK
jgi:hypothetical protein